MAWIKIIEESDAEGLLARLYEAARGRSGKVFNILKLQSTHPPALKAMIELYQSTMLSESPLSRAQREMMAVVVSRANNCHY